MTTSPPASIRHPSTETPWAAPAATISAQPTAWSVTNRLARDRQRRFEQTAASYRLQRQRPPAHRAPVRTGAGWLLVRVGLRLAHIDPFMPAPALTVRN